MTIRIASERALDTMNLCGIRGKLSQGELAGARTYICSNKQKITLYRPEIKGLHEELTQKDIDILRATITRYIEDDLGFQFVKGEPEYLHTGEDVPDTVTAEEAIELCISGKGIGIAITPRDIRHILGVSSAKLKTSEIEHSLDKLATFRAEGIYKVRSPNGALNVSIRGSLLTIMKGSTENGHPHYEILFATKWGRLFLHNIQYGNLTWIKEAQYCQLSDGAKNILYTILAYRNAKFERKETELLSILNIKTGKYRRRAVVKMEKYLNVLSETEYIKWEKRANRKGETIYSITYIVNPLTSDCAEDDQYSYDFSEMDLSEPDEEEIELYQKQYIPNVSGVGEIQVEVARDESDIEAVAKDSIEFYSLMAKKLDEMGQQTEEEKVLLGIIRTVEELVEKIKPGRDKSFENEIKNALLRRNWQGYSPYYLWTVGWFHDYLVKQYNKEDVERVSDCFAIIAIDENLQKNIKNFVCHVEQAYGIYFDGMTDVDMQ